MIALTDIDIVRGPAERSERMDNQRARLGRAPAVPSRPVAAPHAEHTTRAAPNPGPHDASALIRELQATAGNGAVTRLLAHPADSAAPGSAGLVDVQRDRRGSGAGRPSGGTSTAERRTGAAAPTGGTAAELGAAEAWLRYIALRGNGPAPSAAVPAPYRGILAAIQSAVAGPGPIPASELVLDDQAFAEARTMLGRLRADHARLTPRADYGSYDLAEVAIERGQANFAGGEGTFEGGANQLDQAQILLSIQSAADDELRAARTAGYQIPKALRELPSEAQAQFDAARGGWQRGAPSEARLTTPTDETDLVEFIGHAVETINSMRSRRAADAARARRQEAEALRAAADRQLIDLQAAIADRRRAAFAAGDKDALEKVHGALASLAGAINDTKDAAAIITDRVDQLNTVVEIVGKSGKKLVNLPAVPASISGVADKITSASSKLGQVIELLDLVGPAKTQLESGLKYLKAVDLTLEHFGGKSANPFVAVYVSSYLSPGIKNCMTSIRSIAATISSSNRGAIEQGKPGWVDWSVEQGGAAVYAYLAQVYKVAGAAVITDPAWDFFNAHRADLSAAVGEPMPAERRALSAWASKNRQKLWESFYGSTKPPR